MTPELGIVCGGCSAYSRWSAAVCSGCGLDLSVIGDGGNGLHPPGDAAASETRSNSTRGDGSWERATGTSAAALPRNTSQEHPMDQAKYFVCPSCMTPVPS